MEAPYFIFKCISVGVNKVLLLLLLLISLCERCSFLTSIPDGSTETIADLAPNVIYALPHMHKCHNDLDKH